MALKLIDISKLFRMDKLIQRKSSGSPKEFARKLGFSRSTLFEYLSFLKDEFSAVIHYNRYTHCYEYVEEPKNLYTNNARDRLASGYMESVEGGVGIGCICSQCHNNDCPHRRI